MLQMEAERSLGRPLFSENNVLILGFAIGLAYGAVGLLSGFCLLTSLRHWLTENNGVRIRSYALAMATAIVGAQALAGIGLVDLGKSIYLLPSFSLPLMAIGGLIFGYGMVLSNGCGSRASVLLGKGNLRSFVVLVTLGITAQMTLRGLLAPPRVAALQASSIETATNSLPALIGGGTGRLIAAALVAGVLLVFCFAHKPFRQAWGQAFAGFAIGALIVAAWTVTGKIGAESFDPVPVTSLTFVAPIADSVQYVMLSTGVAMNFGVATIFGVLLGSFITAIVTGRFELEAYRSPRHMLRSMTGAAMMGVGGAMALGCSIGQGLTGLSTLALPSFVALAGIVGGITLGLRGPLKAPPIA
jgi:uncharacterized membrane protein YedE/YeeE